MKKELEFTDALEKTAKITIKLEDGKNGPELSITGTYRNSCGQIQDHIKNLLPKRLYTIWERYHLNDLTPGTPKQESALRKFRKENPTWRYDYSEACAILRQEDLETDGGYKYGSAWLYTPLPSYVIGYLEKL